MSIEESIPERRIFFICANREANKDILSQVPYMETDDKQFVLLYKVLVENSKDEMRDCMITNEFLSRWNVDKERIHQLASENTPILFPVKIISLMKGMEELSELVKKTDSEFRFQIEKEKEKMTGDSVYILTNKNGIYGASSMYYDHQAFLKKFGENFNENLYIVPISIHEIMIIPDNGIFTPDELENALQEINDIGAKAERLGKTILYYDKEKNAISVNAERDGIPNDRLLKKQADGKKIL